MRDELGHGMQISPDVHGRTFQAFQGRFRFPAEESRSPSQLFYSFDLAGVPLQLIVAHISCDPAWGSVPSVKSRQVCDYGCAWPVLAVSRGSCPSGLKGQDRSQGSICLTGWTPETCWTPEKAPPPRPAATCGDISDEAARHRMASL